MKNGAPLTYPTGDEFIDSYIETALRCSIDESTPSGSEPLDKNYSGKDLDPSTLQKIIETCRSFKREHAEILADAVCCPNYDYGCAGHDFWMTRNGHHVGYWSRDTLKDMGTGVRLSKASCGETAIYVGDDGKRKHVDAALAVLGKLDGGSQQARQACRRSK